MRRREYVRVAILRLSSWRHLIHWSTVIRLIGGRAGVYDNNIPETRLLGRASNSNCMVYGGDSSSRSLICSGERGRDMMRALGLKSGISLMLLFP